MGFTGSFLPGFGDITDNMFMEEDRNQRQEFAASQAHWQMDFQREMSNTAYQRAVADMRAAGVNPMLSAHVGGASTPTGASASSGVGGGFSPSGRTSGDAFIGTAAQLQLMSAETEKVEAETQEIKARTPTHGVSIEVMKQNIKESNERIEKLMADVNLARQQERTSASSAGLMDQQRRNLVAELPRILQSVHLMKAQVMELGQRAATGRAEEQKLLNDVKSNLPEIERLIKELERKKLYLDQPRQMNEAGFEELLGSLQRLKRLLPWPFSN